jgi:hypothetical protein|tara:strand:+ start:1071 stop:1514 length:444 start_codon:yes stop_codon:yes gene_type:complete
MRVKKKIAAGHSLDETHPFVVSGLDMEQQNPLNLTLLHVAVGMGYEKLVNLLLENGADASLRDAQGATPQMYAAKMFPNMLALFETFEAAARNAVPSDTERPCAAPSCHKHGEKKCSQCRAAYYCCKECQTADWKRHKKICRAMDVE